MVLTKKHKKPQTLFYSLTLDEMQLQKPGDIKTKPYKSKLSQSSETNSNSKY